MLQLSGRDAAFWKKHVLEIPESHCSVYNMSSYICCVTKNQRVAKDCNERWQDMLQTVSVDVFVYPRVNFMQCHDHKGSVASFSSLSKIFACGNQLNDPKCFGCEGRLASMPKFAKCSWECCPCSGTHGNGFVLGQTPGHSWWARCHFPSQPQLGLITHAGVTWGISPLVPCTHVPRRGALQKDLWGRNQSSHGMLGSFMGLSSLLRESS